MKVNVRVEDRTYTVEIENLNSNPVIAVVEGQRFEVWAESPSSAPPAPLRLQIKSNGYTNGHQRNVRAPIPGVIIAVSVQAGERIEQGQEVCVLEAMKMKQSIRAAQAGKAISVPITVGQQVKHHELLVEIGD